jgi:hypothetical protein
MMPENLGDRSPVIDRLREEFGEWETLLSGLSEKQFHITLAPSTFSIKDTLAHLRAWQQVSIARLEAARLNFEPAYPDWSEGFNPDTQDVEILNARIYQANSQKSWSLVHQEWSDGFVEFLELAGQIPEDDIADTEKYPWLEGYTLLDVLQGSYDHHHIDHLEPLLHWLRMNGIVKSPG